MPDIVLTTLNAKYIHAAFGLRYLWANLGPLQARATLVEFDIHLRPLDIVEAILAREPKIVGLGVYIWNVAPATEVVALLKRLRPDLTVILGGPEVSYEVEEQRIVQLADHVITGEADLAFAQLCRELLAGHRPAQKVIPAPLPDLAQVALPYEAYTDADLAHRIIYVEASRGCPFSCEFCLSSLDIPVRQFPLESFLAALQRLLDRGARQFKFVDRTFNLSLPVSRAILEFLRARYQPGHFFHFEMVPDRLPESLRRLIADFPSGAVQCEVGVQTFNEEVAARISRRQDYPKLEANCRFLREQTGAHVHADLIVGLPGESFESLAAGFDRLVALGPQEIQVGMLKRLRGTPISRHDTEWQMRYNPAPPYDLLENRLLDFATLQRLRRFARYWDLVWNSGNFVETAPKLWSEVGPASPGPMAQTDGTGATPAGPSPFAAFLRWSDWLFAQVGRTDSIALLRLAELLFRYLTVDLRRPASSTAASLLRDWQRAGRREVPEFLRAHLPAGASPRGAASCREGLKRQRRHLGQPAAPTPNVETWEQTSTTHVEGTMKRP
jgi:radical SAM superfamily enzyme YgiQ (UPF0313 family)